MAQTVVVTQHAIPLDAPLQWKQALAGIPHSFFHTWEHSYAMHLTHRQPAFLYCVESGGVRVICPFIERPFGEYVDIATPYGFSGFAGNGEIPELAENWHNFAAERNYVCAFINLHPLFVDKRLFDEESLCQQKELYFLDLRRTEEELLARWSRRRRRELRNWQGTATLVDDRKALTSFILSSYKDFYRGKEVSSAYGFTAESMSYLLCSDHVMLLGAARGAKIEAACVVGQTDFVAEGVFNFSLPGARRHGVGLIWEAAKRLKRQGVPMFNLGGGLAANDQLALFKTRFGPDSFTLFALKQVFAPEVYEQLCENADVSAEDRSAYFPRYRGPAINNSGVR